MFKRSLAFTAPWMLTLAIAPVAIASAGAATRTTGDPYQATVTKVVRRVEWERSGTHAWQPAFKHTFLMPGDTLRTGAGAKAELLYGDGSVSRVGSLTALTLTGAGKRELHLNAGRIWLHIQKSGFGMKVITPGAVAAVTGTELMVEFDPKRKLTQVTVFEGAVNVAGDVGELVRVLGGTTTQVPFRAPALAPFPLDKGKLQERENLFKPLAVPESKGASDPTDANGKKPPEDPSARATTKPEGDPSPAVGVASPEAKVTPGAVATPDAKSSPGTATAPDKSQPQTANPTAASPDQKPVSPDLKAQAQRNNDPRLLNGSPTTGGVKVIIR